MDVPSDDGCRSVTSDIRAPRVDGYHGIWCGRDSKITSVAQTSFKGGAQQFGVTDAVPAARHCADRQ